MPQASGKGQFQSNNQNQPPPLIKSHKRSWQELMDADILPPITIFQDVVTTEDKVMLVSGSKNGKSFLLEHMAICLASGVPWLDQSTGLNSDKYRKVFLIDFENKEFYFRKRLQSIAASLGLMTNDQGLKDNLATWSLRGETPTYEQFASQIEKEIGNDKFHAIIGDPYYKLARGLDENSAGDVAKVMDVFERITRQCCASFFFAQHSPKGDTSARSLYDLASGSGVFGRDMDVVFGLRRKPKDIDPNHKILEFGIRNFRPKKALDIEWDEQNCIHKVVGTATSSQQVGSSGRPHKAEVQEVVDVLGDLSMSTSDWCDKATAELLISESTFMRRKKEAIDLGMVRPNAIDSSLWEKVK